MDSGYQGIQHDHTNSSLPIKKKKGQTLTSEAKRMNRQLASERALNEHIIGRLTHIEQGNNAKIVFFKFLINKDKFQKTLFFRTK